MSFCTEQKIEIIEQVSKNACCRRAMMQGILSARSSVCGKGVELSVDSERTAAFISELISEIYSKDASVSTSQRGGRCRIVSFESPSAVKYINAFRSGELYFSEKCPACQGAFLRGLFLACGRVSDPRSQYCLEFSVGESAERVMKLFEQLDMTPRLANKKGERVIYFKRSGYIEDFFALSGMNNTAFAYMNEKINGELRNNVNRITNCTTSNIDKAVSASMYQISLIQELIDRRLISQLPEELEATARLRLMHTDLSLSQLAALTTPRISKPGLSHRLKKITELAETLLKKK